MKYIKLFEETENIEIPENAEELVVGKNYSGRADGSFEIKTINGKLYFIPKTPCCDFGEDY